MSDREARDLERQVLAGDAAALERLKALWLRQGGEAPKAKKRARTKNPRNPPALTARDLARAARNATILALAQGLVRHALPFFDKVKLDPYAPPGESLIFGPVRGPGAPGV